MTNVPFERIEQFRDIETLNHFSEVVGVRGVSPDEVLPALRRASRDNARTPVQWSGDPHAGFTTGTPWIEVHPNHTRINAAEQRGRAGSVFEFYRALVALRHTSDIVVEGAFELLAAEHPSIFAFRRVLAGQQLVVAANLGADHHAVPTDVNLDGTLVIGNYPDRAEGLRPWEAIVVESSSS
jgi:oligo-1,6-glucosidase